MPTELIFVILFSVATAVALVARRFEIPYTVALVVAGLVLGPVVGLRPPLLDKQLLYAIFLPGLLFEAAFHLELKRFWESRITIPLLAVPGVLAAAALTAALLLAMLKGSGAIFGIASALVFGALSSATDPIAVVALFKSLGAPKRLAVLVESESLLNDATAAVLLTVLLSAFAGDNISVTEAILAFLRILGIGIAVGAALAFCLSFVINHIDDPMLEITLTTIAAYGSFAIAESLGASGVIATVTAGIICGNYGARIGMTPATKAAVEAFWEYLTFALNSLVFLLIGFQIHASRLWSSWQVIVPAFAAMTLARAMVVAFTTVVVRRTKERYSWAWATVLFWGGMRGSLSMVLVLALPAAFPERDTLITMTYGVVIVSILLQGLSMPKLLSVLGLVSEPATT